MGQGEATIKGVSLLYLVYDDDDHDIMIMIITMMRMTMKQTSIEIILRRVSNC